MKHQLLFLHVAGGSDKERTRYLQNLLIREDIESFSFNFTGYSGNNLSASSLDGRFQEADEAIQKFHLHEPLNLCGSSMGGYIAIKLCEKYSVENLFLFAPAVYTTKVFRLKFDEKFGETIRQKESWKDSDAFTILVNFTGNVVVFIGENDEVIPSELIKML
ncbi:MAG TPA: YqiA/YcfP family alpha/beta fold hydrolase, partial [Patescibacteria group bacterium]|nr:YqiA/YcfP family alpha/beta fold hydrolase [Patescibacteria group bacterium]